MVRYFRSSWVLKSAHNNDCYILLYNLLDLVRFGENSNPWFFTVLLVKVFFGIRRSFRAPEVEVKTGGFSTHANR